MICSLLAGVNCVGNKLKFDKNSRIPESSRIENWLFYTQFSPLNAGNHLYIRALQV